MKKGIDVSTHQNKIDWKKVKADNIEFAILRSGYGSELSQEDLWFDKNYAGCKDNGIPTGTYWYSYAIDPEGAKREAEICLKVLKGKQFEYPIYFDIEDKTQLALSEESLQKIAAAFCDILEAAGYWAGIYSYKAFLEASFTPDTFSRYAIWVAHTGVKQTTFRYPYGMWQYSHTGKINGVDTVVDLNYCYEDYPEAMRAAGLNGYIKPDGTKYTEHTVVDNESLWVIAEKYLGSGLRYPEIKTINMLKSDTIYTGQILKIPPK